MRTIIKLLFALCILLFYQSLSAQVNQRKRVLVLTDIEADPDDAESMVRFLTYANEWDIEGLIAATSIHQKTTVAPGSIKSILLAYKKIQPKLLKHEQGFPLMNNSYQK